MEGRETCRRISEIVRCTSGSLCQWIGWFREGGIEELLGHIAVVFGPKDETYALDVFLITALEAEGTKPSKTGK